MISVLILASVTIFAFGCTTAVAQREAVEEVQAFGERILF